MDQSLHPIAHKATGIMHTKGYVSMRASEVLISTRQFRSLGRAIASRDPMQGAALNDSNNGFAQEQHGVEKRKRRE